VKKLVLAAALVLLMLSCGVKRPQGGAGASGAPVQSAPRAEPGRALSPGKPVIGFSIATDTFATERWNKDVKVFSAAARELGADVIVQLAAGGTKEQISQINYLTNQNIDILVMVAHDTDELAGAVRQVKAAGIPVIAYDRLIIGVPLDAYISFDSREVGRFFALASTRAAPRGNYLIVNGSVHDTNSFQISAGVHEIIDPFIASGSVRLEKEIWLEEWSSDEALVKIGEIFEESERVRGGVKFDVIICGNDAIAGAAIQLLAERRLAGTVKVIGQDAELISCQHIVEGLQLMTVYKPIGSLASRAAALAVAMVSGSPLPPPDVMLDNKSGQSVPSYIEAAIAIGKENMDIVVRDGFHSYEDIYRNILENRY
jgi:D-xylose transport system substrate-binding protein